MAFRAEWFLRPHGSSSSFSYTCCIAGISAAHYLSPPRRVFLTSRRVQTAQCAPGKRLARQPKPRGTALPSKGLAPARVAACVACTSLWVCGKCSSTYLLSLRRSEAAARVLPRQQADVSSPAAVSAFLFGCPYRSLGVDESPVLKRPFSGRPAFVIRLLLDQCLQGAEWGAVWPLLLSLLSMLFP